MSRLQPDAYAGYVNVSRASMSCYRHASVPLAVWLKLTASNLFMFFDYLVATTVRHVRAW